VHGRPALSRNIYEFRLVARALIEGANSSGRSPPKHHRSLCDSCLPHHCRPEPAGLGLCGAGLFPFTTISAVGILMRRRRSVDLNHDPGPRSGENRDFPNRFIPRALKFRMLRRDDGGGSVVADPAGRYDAGIRRRDIRTRTKGPVDINQADGIWQVGTVREHPDPKERGDHFGARRAGQMPGGSLGRRNVLNLGFGGRVSTARDKGGWCRLRTSGGASYMEGTTAPNYRSRILRRPPHRSFVIPYQDDSP